MGTEAVIVETLSELRREIDKVHELYLTANTKLNEAREANRKLRRRMVEVYGVKEASKDAQDHTASM